MADRDWEKELAKVDKQLASLSDDTLAGPPPAAPAKGKVASQPVAPAPATVRSRWTIVGVYARLTLAVALGVAMTVWPYQSRCGLGLAAYLAAVGVVVASGAWSAVWSWRHRAAKAHTLSLLIVLWGLVLGSIDILPRIGYAKPDATHPVGWTCP
jgi:hypothetical protein